VQGIPNAALFSFCRTLDDVGCGFYPNSKFVHVDVRKPGTGHKKNSPAVAFAVRDFINRKKAKDFGRMLREGKFDYPATNEETESRDI
jgi:hypothetical protein